jgi:hypothetical protein
MIFWSEILTRRDYLEDVDGKIRCNFTCCFVWVLKLVSHTKGRDRLCLSTGC